MKNALNYLKILFLYQTFSNIFFNNKKKFNKIKIILNKIYLKNKILFYLKRNELYITLETNLYFP